MCLRRQEAVVIRNEIWRGTVGRPNAGCGEIICPWKNWPSLSLPLLSSSLFAPPVNKILRVLPLALQYLNPTPELARSLLSPPRNEPKRRCLLREGGKRFFVPLKLGLRFSRLGAPNGISVYARNLLDAATGVAAAAAAAATAASSSSSPPLAPPGSFVVEYGRSFVPIF